MSMVTVYKFRRYDIGTDETITSRRMATRDAIKYICAELIEGTDAQVDSAELDGNGMTERNFNPNQSTGFQTNVM